MEKYSLLTKLPKGTLNIALKLTFSVFLFNFSLYSDCISDLLGTFKAFFGATVFHRDDSRGLKQCLGGLKSSQNTI